MIDRVSDIRPLYDNVLLREREDLQKSPIVLPDSAKQENRLFEVVAVGDGHVLDSGQTVPLAVKVGDLVVFGNCTANGVRAGGEKLIIIQERVITAIVGRATEPKPLGEVLSFDLHRQSR